MALLTCSVFSSGSAATPAAESVQAIYDKTCAVCHAEGVHGAPRPGVKSDWETPLSYGVEEIYLNTLEGIGEMPRRGMCTDCTDDQLKAVVDFMIRSSL